MADRLILRTERHGDITRFVDQHGWTRGLLWWEEGLGKYLTIAPLGLIDRDISVERRYSRKATAIADTKQIIKEAWNA